MTSIPIAPLVWKRDATTARQAGKRTAFNDQSHVKLPMCFAHIFLFRNPGTGHEFLIAAGSGFNGCATATDFHRDSLLQNNHFRGQYNEFSCECKWFFQEKTIFF
jgi:hypothetical protein